MTSETKKPTPPATKDELVQSLASFVSPEDVGMPRKEFLRTVAARILDDIGV